MLFVGAGGLAAQLFEDLLASHLPNVVFWSGVETHNEFIKEKFKIISTDEQVEEYFNTVSRSFVMCIGDIPNRKMLSQKFISLGGTQNSFITPFCKMSPFLKQFGSGNMVLHGAELEPGTTVGNYNLFNKYSKIGHGCIIGNNCEIAPMAVLAGNVRVGDDTLIGINAVVLPKMTIGTNVTIAAGAVVTKHIPDNAVVAGVPGVVRFFKKIKDDVDIPST